MSTAVFPTLVGLSFDVIRTPQWSTIIQEAASGKETRVAKRSFPRRTWELTYDLLRSDSVNLELQTLEGFFNLRQGAFDSFLFNDPDDNTVTGQAFGTGNGVATAFQLARTWGGFSEEVTAPHTVSTVYVGGVAQSGGAWSVTNWTAPSTSGGVVTFVAAPTGALTADMTYYWPVRFVDDTMTFSKFMNAMWAGKKVSFVSIV
jgi:uncharacterized protein (TIGR02217 family)